MKPTFAYLPLVGGLFVLTLSACVLAPALRAGDAAPAASSLRVAAAGERPVAPCRGLTYTPEGIETVRETARDSTRGQLLAAEIFENAQPWLAMSDEEIRALVPTADSVLAVGYAGDPKTGQSWPSWARSGGMCSLDRPGTVRSPYTGDIYGAAGPGEEYYDAGDGWVRPSDQKRFYFKGVWNSWIIDQMHDAVDTLSLAYMLSGDPAVADRALLILDELATLVAQRSPEQGAIDGFSYGKENKNFLCYSGNHANSRTLNTVFALDLLGNVSRASQSAGDGSGRTVFEKIRDQYFDVYELNYKETRHTLYNHTTILYANELAQGVLFGNPEMIREGIDVLVVWLEQTLNRDGQYYENAGGYERVGVNYAATLMLPLSNYDPSNYPDPQLYPKPEDYPFALKFGNDPSWYSAAFLMKYRMMASGRMIAFGDMWEDRLVLPGEVREWDPRLWCSFARLLYWQTDNEEWKEQISERYWSLPEEVRSEPTLGNVYEMGMSQWIEPERPHEEPEMKDSLLQDSSDLLPAKMIALVRSGEGEDHRAAFLSGSVHYSHGHDDQLGLILYAKGMNLTGIYGYPAAGSPAHRGWAIKPASHWTLVVNEDLPAPDYPAKNAPPASLQGWVTKDMGLSAQLVEMSNPYLWQDRIAPDMSEYRRLLWMVDVSDEEFYYLDFFRAEGGRTHDYFWTGQWLDQASPGEGFAVDGIEPEEIPGVWSLAGLNPRYRDADFNVPGRSWGERLDPGKRGTIRPIGIPGEAINIDSAWNPPPQNGYGFIYDVKEDVTDDNWSASWDLIDGRNTMRLTFVNNEEQEAIVARNPAAEVDRYHSMVVARRSGAEPLKSQFAALVEVAEDGQWPVLEAERIELDPAAGMGVRLTLDNGCTDTLLAGQSERSKLDDGEVRLVGARGFVRTGPDGDVREMLLHEGTFLEAGAFRLTFPEPNWRAKVIEVIPDDRHNRVVLDDSLPTGRILAGQPVMFSGDKGRAGPATLQDVTYMIEAVSASPKGSVLDFGSQRMVSSTVVVDTIEADGAVTSTWPNEILGGRYRDTGYYTGRKVAAAGDRSRSTVVESYPNRKKFYPHEGGLFKSGEKLEFYLVQDGDQARIPHVATLKQMGEGQWRLSSNAAVGIRIPVAQKAVLYASAGGTERKLAASANGFVECVVPVDWTVDGNMVLDLRPE
ncbi:heparinase II/III family protein [Ruficoccus amylovorans]|uniref:Heparinase II/III family protein n=1 Tax=Ruficoccus amylovorans TaxID=1804625 RepID=A0A842HJB3_9BACT|nr:heparinase II/III family protein [Ruficoccus amylovorans]MBC2595714.1 heparinase II/III family protein [Ruficoccus amylovorans]